MSEALKNSFIAFASYGSGGKTVTDIDNKNFSKLCKDCKIIDGKKITATDVDLVFAKVKDKTARRIAFQQFCNALVFLAEKKGVDPSAFHKLVENGSPTSQATKADAVKFHDDKSLYTGVYAKGGPTNVDKAKAGGLAGLLDRSPADVRGIKK